MQRRLNPDMKEEVKNKVIKLQDNGIIYPISDSKWVSPTQVVPKKSGVTVITNEKNELIPTRTITGWRMCIQKLDTTKRLMSFPKCRSVEVINNPARPGSNHREVNCINYN